jgi:hypothetical protein
LSSAHRPKLNHSLVELAIESIYLHQLLSFISADGPNKLPCTGSLGLNSIAITFAFSSTHTPA